MIGPVRVLLTLVIGAVMLIVLPLTLILLLGVLGPFLATFTGMEAFGRDVIGMIATGEALLAFAVGGVLVIPAAIWLQFAVGGGREPQQRRE